MMPVRLEPAALRSRVKHSTTEPLGSLVIIVDIEKIKKVKVNCEYDSFVDIKVIF